MPDTVSAETFSRWIKPAHCSICGARVSAHEALVYPGFVCDACDSRALNAEGKRAEYSSVVQLDDGSFMSIDAEGDNPVFIDGMRCWRQYHLGTYVTIRDITGAESYYEHTHRHVTHLESAEYERIGTMLEITLASGLKVAEPLARLLSFCAEEYDYYDGIPDLQPHSITPMDVLATVSMSAFFNNNPEVIRDVHRGLAAACNPLLAQLPREARLELDEIVVRRLPELLTAALTVPGVLIPRATKVLHRKRPALIPMLDNEVIRYYSQPLGIPNLVDQMQSKGASPQLAMQVIEAFQADLRAALGVLRLLQEELAGEGFALSLVRILELLIWIAVEPRHHYPAFEPQDVTVLVPISGPFHAPPGYKTAPGYEQYQAALEANQAIGGVPDDEMKDKQ